MALTTKRIIALPSQTDPHEGDYLAIDNAQNGTHKIPVGRFGVEVDDTLTEQGKAADAKAVGDALDEIRSQVEATDDAIDEIRSQIEVTGTASGAIATFTDGAEMPAKSVIVNIEPQQSGTGTPSPDNVRPISGWTEVTVFVSPTEDEEDATTHTTSLDRTVYGGTVDVVSGTLTVPGGYLKLNTATIGGSESWPSWVNSGVRAMAGGGLNSLINGALSSISDKVYANTSGTNDLLFFSSAELGKTKSELIAMAMDVEFYIPLATPQTYQLTPTEIQTLLGENNVWADSGDVEVVYVRDLNIAINNLLNSNGTRSLGMMAMSAPTKDTAEEPTDEQTEEPAEDDMR